MALFVWVMWRSLSVYPSMADRPGHRTGLSHRKWIGDSAVSSNAPRWWMLLTEEQTRQIGVGTPVSVRIDGATVSGQVIAVVEDREQGRFEAEIARSDGTSICAATCVESVPLDSEIHVYPASIELIEQRSGPLFLLPHSPRLLGEAVLIMDDGGARVVEVIASSSGLAIVDGVEIGERIQLPFGEQP